MRLKEARVRAGYATAKDAATAMGVAVPTYIQHENGSRGIPKDRAERYGRFFGVPPEFLLFGNNTEWPMPPPAQWHGVQVPRPNNVRWVPILGEVQAGLWSEALEMEPETVVPVSIDGYEGASLFALRVKGPSMDKFYSDGSMVIVCPAIECGIREGDHVVVRRHRNGMVETTLKEVVKEKEGIALWPRSSDPHFQEPIRIKSVEDTDEGPEIIAVVIAGYTIRPTQRKPLIQL